MMHMWQRYHTQKHRKNYFLFISTLNLSPYHLQNLDDKDDELLLWNHGVWKLWCASRFNPHSIAPTPTTLQNLICWWWRWQIMIHKRHHELVIQESRFKAHNIWCTYPNHQQQITQKVLSFDPWNVSYQCFDLHSWLDHLGVRIHETYNMHMMYFYRQWQRWWKSWLLSFDPWT